MQKWDSTVESSNSSGWIFVLLHISLKAKRNGMISSDTDIQEAGMVYISTLSQVRVLQKTLELFDLRGE